MHVFQHFSIKTYVVTHHWKCLGDVFIEKSENVFQNYPQNPILSGALIIFTPSNLRTRKHKCPLPLTHAHICQCIIFLLPSSPLRTAT